MGVVYTGGFRALVKGGGLIAYRLYILLCCRVRGTIKRVDWMRGPYDYQTKLLTQYELRFIHGSSGCI